MIGIIGGTGFYNVDLFGEAQEINVETEYGAVELLKGSYKGLDIVFLPRHGKGHSRLAFEITHHANLLAFKELGINRVMATVAAGGINPTYKGGDMVVIDQFINFHTRHFTYGKMSLDMTEPYCSQLRNLFADKAKELGYGVHVGGTYVSVDGPRYETAAEIRAYKLLGADLVGMTNAPEATLARELGLCYMAVCMVTNMAAGLSSDEPDLKAHSLIIKNNADKLTHVLCETALAIPKDMGCRCKEWYDRAANARK